MLLGTFFGFISSSCSFSALATAKTLFAKGANFVAAMAFLLASTNLVIELGIVISLFLGWQFVVGEYVGGVLLILIVWLLFFLFRPNGLIKQARDRLNENKSQEHDHEHNMSLGQKLTSRHHWITVAHKYKMEWGMVWKDVTIGFTLAGIISAFVPNSFFETLFIGAGTDPNPGFWTLVEHAFVGPFAAFLTFIGSMGNIPLAALLLGKGVSFAGVMAFIFSDLVVFPVLRINAKYYGWKLALVIMGFLFIALVITSLLLHYGMDWAGALPTEPANPLMQQDFFAFDYSFVLNLIFLAISFLLLGMVWLGKDKNHQHQMAMKSPWLEKLLLVLAFASYGWLAVGLVIYLI